MRPHAIITGGSSGIGLAIAEQLIVSGYDISILARDLAKIETACAHLEQRRRTPAQIVWGSSTDVTDEPAVRTTIDQAIENCGAPTLVVNSAGVVIPGRFEALSAEDFAETLTINLLGTVNVVRSCLPSMKDGHRGSIVILASAAAIIGVYGYTAYSASKFALRGFAEALRSELRPFGITVSVVYPPDTDTPQLEKERHSRPPETQAICGKAEALSATAVARATLAGTARGQFSIYPSRSIGLLARTYSLMEPLVHWYTDRLVRKVRSTQVSPQRDD